MEIIYNDIFLQHKTGGHHPENCKRLQAFQTATTAVGEASIAAEQSDFALTRPPAHEVLYMELDLEEYSKKGLSNTTHKSYIPKLASQVDE